MKTKIGIPRGLLYYYYYPLWVKFFEILGGEVIVSRKTNKSIVDEGVRHTVDEACLPVKVFHGHVNDLKDKADYIFIPKIMSIYKDEYICPKFCGLPEMVSHSIDGLPEIIEPVIDFSKSKRDLYKIVHEVGRYLTDDTQKIDFAFKEALKDYYQYRASMKKGVLPIDVGEKKPLENINTQENRKKILLLGHPYNIYDTYLSMDIINKLRGYGLEVMTQDSFDTILINEWAKTMDKKIFWSFGRKILGTGLYAMHREDIQGVIYMSSFGCGLDSVVGDIIERKIRRNSQKPFTLLTIDEHTGEAGLDTRIEAFVDMIKWREKDENNLSAHGEYLYTY